MDRIKDQAAFPKLKRYRKYFSVFSANFLLYIKLAIQRRNIKIFLGSISKNSVVPKREIGRVFLSYELDFTRRFSLYRMKEDLGS